MGTGDENSRIGVEMRVRVEYRRGEGEGRRSGSESWSG